MLIKRKRHKRILIWRHAWRWFPKNSYTKTTTKVLFSILRYNLSKFITQTGLYCNMQLETTFSSILWKTIAYHLLGTEGMLNCSMVRFPTGHYWHCSWLVKKASPGMCPCKWCTFWTPFVNKLLQTICIFRMFWFKWLLSIMSPFYCVDAWWLIGLPCLAAKL